MPFDIGGGRRQPGFRTNTNAPVNRSRAAVSQRHRSRISTVRQIATAPTLSAKQRIASAPKHQRAALTQTLHRVLNAYASGPKYGSTFTPDEAASLVRSVGGSKSEASALSTKIVGESGGNPKAVGHDPGGTTGLGLWQLTTGVGNDDLINKYGGPDAMLKPKPNAKAALDLYRSGGLGNWYAGSNPPGNPSKVPPVKKPSRKDLKTLVKSGIQPKQRVASRASSAGPHPFKKAAARATSGGGIVSPKWAPGEEINRGINPVVKSWAKRYGASLSAGYDPGGGHVSPGHNVTGTATDMVPAGGWSNPQAVHHFEQGLRVLSNSGFEVLYGTDGIGHAYPNHGRGNHAHIEWANIGNAWSAGSSAALQKLGGLSNSQIKQIQNTKGTGATSMSGIASAVSGYANSTGQTPQAAAKSLAKMTPQQRQQAIRKALNKALSGYGGVAGSTPSSPTTGTSGLSHRYGHPSV